MKNRLQLMAMMLLTLSAGSGAKDLGTWGHVFEPAEQDMLAFIQNRLQGMEQTGELDRLRREATDRVKYRSFAWDPTFTVKETITDMQGNVIARKGDRVNPFDKVAYSQTLYFIDGDSRDQVRWVKQQIADKAEFKLILVNGNIRDVSEATDEPVYFDQAGVLTTRFGFEHTPVRITRDYRVLKIEEIPVTGAKQ